MLFYKPYFNVSDRPLERVLFIGQPLGCSPLNPAVIAWIWCETSVTPSIDKALQSVWRSGRALCKIVVSEVTLQLSAAIPQYHVYRPYWL